VSLFEIRTGRLPVVQVAKLFYLSLQFYIDKYKIINAQYKCFIKRKLKLSIEIMRIILNIFAILILFITGCGIHQNDMAKDYNDFAIRCAKMGLWNESIMRWKRVVEIQPNNPQVYNNLGVAYEAKGDMENALMAYNKAIELDPENNVYKSNYIRFKRNYDRNKRMQETRDKIQKTDDKLWEFQDENQNSE